MDVTVNGEARLVVAGTTVDGLVDEIGCGRKGIAVAVNEEVVPRSMWARTEVRPRDRVEILTPAQGG
jgi:sulfur carrier protein